MPTPVHIKDIRTGGRRQKPNVTHIESHNPRHGLVDVVEDVGVGSKKLITRSKNVKYNVQ